MTNIKNVAIDMISKIIKNYVSPDLFKSTLNTCHDFFNEEIDSEDLTKISMLVDNVPDSVTCQFTCKAILMANNEDNEVTTISLSTIVQKFDDYNPINPINPINTLDMFLLDMVIFNELKTYNINKFRQWYKVSIISENANPNIPVVTNTTWYNNIDLLFIILLTTKFLLKRYRAR
ncbi:hypothetical protein QLL95_gp0511 [Cotonvirus japonicus]|uniref:Uncharacterized protein n=1 Tax=Cotonvirus japonicus TaxID=2811091 RepID=A0ABM7NTW1_9VIRU|nr:hypothetical protein QLL95_gp0511 [Cotonvirus japonicus]BCS83612.1 hypothetical protein [Cotonvirus japonicus]